MTDQPADLLTAAAQRIREGDHRIDVALRGPIAAWLDDAEHRVRAAEQAAAKVWPDDLARQDEFKAGEIPWPAIEFARAVLGQDGQQCGCRDSSRPGLVHRPGLPCYLTDTE